MNRLQNETSPYLLQHKDNPVDWYPWNKEAIQKAKEEDKPIILSIGYSACHWCHVMAHESFENNETARLMNENFINIKVDREERPDIDNIYMSFVQLTTGSGGWPLTVALTPDLIPYFGGTYFPPEDRFGKPGFPKVLKILSDAYKNKKTEIQQQRQDIIEALTSVSSLNKSENEYSNSDFDKAFDLISELYDDKWGGFGKVPKFPSAMTLMFLLRYFQYSANPIALDMVEHTLQKMASGGIYDQIGGGFHRYSTDTEWLIPHFEKMLYDNALLARIYIEAFQVTKNDFYLGIAEDILGYVLREMKDQSGGFYSAQDADSEGEEGKYFIWDSDEIRTLLPLEDYDIVAEFYGISESGNFEGKNILTAHNSIKDISQKFNIKERELINKLSSVRAKLFQKREKRIKPGLDDKILVSWNSLTVIALCKAYAVTGKEKYLKAALSNANFIWSNCFRDGQLFHSYKNNNAKIAGLLDDYSFTSEAFFELYSVTFNEEWVDKANVLIETAIQNFYDEKNKDFFYTPINSEELIIRAKDAYDNSMPSGNSSVVISLLYSSILCNKPEYYDIAVRNFNVYHDAVIQYPLSFSYLLTAAFLNFIKPKEIVLISKDEISQKLFLKKYFNDFYPFSILAGLIQNSNTSLELFNEKKLLHENNTIYVCENYSCNSPVGTYEEMKMEVILK